MLARRVFGRAAFAVVALTAFARPAAAQPADQETINQRIELGKKFLMKEQKPAGFWGDGTGPGPDKGWGVGYTALAGLALIECGVDPKDPVIKKAANVVRAVANELDSTYELALAILFLDRVNDKNDERYIQFFAGRLISAQMPSGGWGYKTHKYPEDDVKKLLTALRRVSPPADPKAPDKPADKAADPLKERAKLPGDLKRVAVLDDLGTGRLPADAKEKRNDLLDATTDNSNTHFAMIGLWAARKHSVPVDRTFALVSRRFRTSQGGSGTWGYDFVRTGADGGNQFTCIALLGVAIGHAVAPDPEFKPETDPVIIKAFVSLSRAVGAPTGDINKAPKVKDIPGGFYFLWAMERIAVLYDIQKFGKKDWYQWGAETLVGNQQADGSWSEDGGFPGQTPIVNTCMALLFLKRANLTPDLSKKLKVDPGVLTAKVEDTIAPKPPAPSPKVEEPPPSPKVEEPPAPKVEPKKEPPAPPPAPVQETAAPAPAKKTPWPLIILGVVLAGAVGGGLAFLVVKRKNKDGDDEDEDDKKKKKGKKKSAAAGGKAKPKAKADVEVDEDDE